LIAEGVALHTDSLEMIFELLPARPEVRRGFPGWVPGIEGPTSLVVSKREEGQGGGVGIRGLKRSSGRWMAPGASLLARRTTRTDPPADSASRVAELRAPQRA